MINIQLIYKIIEKLSSEEKVEIEEKIEREIRLTATQDAIFSQALERSENEDPQIILKGRESSRVKDGPRRICKMLRQAEAVAASLIKDGIGIRFEVGSVEEAILLIEKLMEKGGALKQISCPDKFEFRCKNIPYDPALEAKLISLGFSNTKAENHAFFQDLKIIGETIGEDGIKRHFEIQIVLVNNKNETGLAHHKIMEADQAIEALCRLSSTKTIPEAILKKIEEKAFQESYYEDEDEQVIAPAEKIELKKRVQATKFIRQCKNRSRIIDEKKMEQYQNEYSQLGVSDREIETEFIKKRKEGIKNRLRKNLIKVGVNPNRYMYVQKDKEGIPSHLLQGTGLLDQQTEWEYIAEAQGAKNPATNFDKEKHYLEYLEDTEQLAA